MLDTVGAATGDTTKCPVRPTGRQERQASGRQPEDLSGINPARFPLASRRCNRDEWRGRSSNRDSRRHARCHFSPPIDWRVTNERSSVSCHRWRVAVRGRVTGAGVKVPRLHHGEAETEVAHGPLPRVDLARRARK